MRIIGLDIGISSIGWCVLENQNLVGLGARVFPPKKNVGGLSCQQQRLKHKADRIKNSRLSTKLRQMAQLLVAAGLLPENGRAATPNVAQFFVCGITIRLEAFQFGAALMFLAKHRGKPPRKAKLRYENKQNGFNVLPGKSADWDRRDATHAFGRLWRVQMRYHPTLCALKRAEIARHLFALDDPALNITSTDSVLFRTPIAVAAPLNNAVDRNVRQLSKVLDAIVRRFGKPDYVACEMFQRPSPNFENGLVKIVRRSAKTGFKRANLRELLWRELPELRPDVRQCVYSGTEIAMSEIHGNHIEIDHIVPRSRGGRNVFDNLILCSAAANREKNHRTVQRVPRWQCFFDTILQRAKVLPKAKQVRLETGFEPKVAYEPKLARLARITYIATTYYLVERFKPTSTKLVNFKGHETAKYREHWQLNYLLPQHDAVKNRNDHRHHAIDAFVLGRLAAEALLIPDEQSPLKMLAALLPLVLVSHKVDHGTTCALKIGMCTNGALTQETAYGPTPFRGENGVHYGIIRKPVAELKSANDITMVRDSHLRALLSSRLFAHANVASGVSRHWHEEAALPRRVRVFEPIENPVEVRGKHSRIVKLLKPGANYQYDVWVMANGKYLAEIVTMAQTQNTAWQSVIKQRYPAARKVLKLHHNDCIALDDSGQTVILRVVKFCANGRICLAHVNEAGDLKARDADKVDPFFYTVRSPAGLKNRNARQIRIDILGQISDPFCR